MNAILEFVLITLAILTALGFILRRIYIVVRRGKISCCADCTGCTGCSAHKGCEG